MTLGMIPWISSCILKVVGFNSGFEGGVAGGVSMFGPVVVCWEMWVMKRKVFCYKTTKLGNIATVSETHSYVEGVFVVDVLGCIPELKGEKEK